jgi:multidrug efflux system membrane fusion protein
MHGELPKQLWAKTKRTKRRTLVVGLIVILIAAALIYQFTGSSGPQRRPGRFAADGPVPILVATAAKADVPVYLDAVGTIKALNTVTISPQVDGKLLGVGFKEGDDVKKGDVLARIDPTLYQAQLDQAIAKKGQDEAQLANAKTDLDRYEKLAATNAINRQQADTQRAQVAQFSALVLADQAAIDNARATLAYTTIVAPIDGRTGIRQVDEGNIVRASSATALVTITQIKPISMFFSLPQQYIAQINKVFPAEALAVEALAADNVTVADRGTLKVVDNQVDQTTGTVKLKAEFPNPDLQLWPGQFVNVRLLIDTLRGAIVVPTASVQRGPNGTFVFLVQSGDTVTVRAVTVTQQDEKQTVIASGLQAGDRVVTTGFTRLADGSKITISSRQEADTPAPAPAPPADKSKRGKRSEAAPGSPQ